MCAGALLHARVGRVVFGATDPKAGAAGSVVNVLGEPRLNAHTAVQGGVLAAECGTLLQEFFKARRSNPKPLREDALRTPEARLHTAGRWSYAFSHAAHAAKEAGWRVLAPDFIGFGRSDKPKKAAWHANAPHVSIVQQLLEALGVQRLAWHGEGLGRRVGEELQRTTPQSLPHVQWLAPPPQLHDYFAWRRLNSKCYCCCPCG